VLDYSWGVDFIAASISLHVIDLFRLLRSFWFDFGWSYGSRNLYISSRLSNHLNIGSQSSP
jgi:hypothetical protein